MNEATDLAPATEEGVATALRNAAAPLAVEGHGSRRGMLRPLLGPHGACARVLSTRNLTGITLHRPQEMVLSARAGTGMAEVEAAVAQHHQMLAPEPPDLRALMGVPDAPPPTLGGLVASNLSGPRRITGFALRDAVLGLRFVNGAGEVLRSGGRVHKNVTGLDLCKLLAGSHGTLAVITEVTLKLTPAPERTATLAVPVPDEAAGVALLSAALTSPYGVTGAAMLPAGLSAAGVEGPAALMRLEDVAASVAYRMERLRELAGGRHAGGMVLEGLESRALWRAIRDVLPLAGGDGEEEAVWRLSLRPSAAPAALAALRAAFPARALLDWGGGLLWVAGPAGEEAHGAVMRAALAAGGTFMLMRGPEAMRAGLPVIPDEPRPLAAIAARVKAALDPVGRLNPGRLRPGG